MAQAPRVRVARESGMLPILDIARSMGLPEEAVELFGPFKAKIRPGVLSALGPPRAKLVVVTAMTPTPAGEGKTVNTIGLALGLNRIGKHAICTLRQPSLGPFFGVKGGAAGGGRSRLLPTDDINLRLTGDIDAVAAAHNLLAAVVDNHLYHGNAKRLDPASITWRRVLDVNDRSLREVALSPGRKDERRSGFDIAVASEVMGILALARSYPDLRERLGRIIVGRGKAGWFVTAEDVKAAGAMAALLRDAFKPNLLQTCENTPALVHTGPFGNIAHGNSSILADDIAVRCADFVVTESGFGADLGFEKFIDIKCRTSGLQPSAALVVATVRACKYHGGTRAIKPGQGLPSELSRKDVPAVIRGAENLAAMVRIVRSAGVPAVVAINRFPDDSTEEMEAVADAAARAGAAGVEVIEAYSRGGEGGAAAARNIVRASATAAAMRPFYDLHLPVRGKIEAIATRVYGAAGVDYSARANEDIDRYETWGLGSLPVCMAKTQLSLSHDPALRGAPTGFRVQVKEVRASAGSGYLYPLLGGVMTMPGLPAVPASEGMDIDAEGNLVSRAETVAAPEGNATARTNAD